jgi:DNA transposition AAA+ family ATPase
MLTTIAPTKNIDAVAKAYGSLQTRPQRVPGMMLIHGVAGYGKTTACEHLLDKYGGASIRCQAFWSASGMLNAICESLSLDSATRPYQTLELISIHLKRNPKPLVIDEIDHLFHKPILLEGLRDIHDKTGSPVVMVGMAGADRKFLRHPQLLRRITQFVELTPLDMADLKSIAKVVCSSPLADDLLDHILDSSKGSTGLAVVGLSQIERFCPTMKQVNLKHWQEVGAPLFLGSRVV